MYSDYAFYTEDIANMEIEICSVRKNLFTINEFQVLKWDLCAPTVSYWLGHYLQNAARWFPQDFAASQQPKHSSNHFIPHFRRRLLPVTAQHRSEIGRNLFKTNKFLPAISLLDISIHDLESLVYLPSMSAAAAFYISCCQDLKHSGTKNLSFISHFLGRSISSHSILYWI